VISNQTDTCRDVIYTLGRMAPAEDTMRILGDSWGIAFVALQFESATGTVDESVRVLHLQESKRRKADAWRREKARVAVVATVVRTNLGHSGRSR